MANIDHKEKREEAENQGFNSKRSDWNLIHSAPSIGMYQCIECKSQKTSSFQLQIRSADEPMTT